MFVLSNGMVFLPDTSVGIELLPKLFDLIPESDGIITSLRMCGHNGYCWTILRIGVSLNLLNNLTGVKSYEGQNEHQSWPGTWRWNITL